MADKVQGKSNKCISCANGGIFTKANRKLVISFSAYVQRREEWASLMVSPEHQNKASALKLSLSSSVFVVCGDGQHF